jgi:hypothetical protein
MVAIAAGAVVAAGCGGSSMPGATSKTTSTTVESVETRAWVAAAARGVQSSFNEKLSAADAECLGRALVDTVRVDRLKAAGVTTKSLEDPNADLPAVLNASLPIADKQALGAAVEACGDGIYGRLLAEGMADGVRSGYKLDAGSRACVNQWSSSPDHQVLIGTSVLTPKPTPAEAAQVADLIVTCLDVATLIAPSMHTTFSGAETACVNQLARTSPDLRTAFASEIAGSANSTTRHQEELFGASIVKCLTPQHLLQLGKANGG